MKSVQIKTVKDPISAVDINRNFIAVKESVNQLTSNSLLDPIVIMASLTEGKVNTVAHKLGKSVFFYSIGLPNVGCIIWEAGPPDNTYIYLNTNASCTVPIKLT